MKRKAITIMTILFLASTIMALFPLSVKAKATKTPFTGTSTLVDVIYPGDFTFPGGNIHARDRRTVYYELCSDARITGTDFVVANANFDSDMTGPIWGTFTLEVVEGGWWEGTWTGKIYADGTTSLRAVARGRGSFEGLKAKLTIEYPADPTIPGEISGYILEK